MIIDLPDTKTTQVNKALVDLRERHGAVALGRVLTLVLVTVEEESEAAIAAANHASYEHPCRVIAVVAGRGRGDARLDAQIRVGGDAGASDVVLLHTYGDLIDHPASVIMPLLLPDAPVVAWWPGVAPAAPAEDPVGRLAQRRITDAAAMRRPLEALEACRTGYQPGDTDFAWSRLTLWRAILAAALDQEPDPRVLAASVVGGADSPSTDLLAGWLALSLDCPVERVSPEAAEGLVGVELQLERGSILLDRAPDEDVALLVTPGRQEQVVALQHRLDRECLAEELRRLDPDEVYGEVLTEGLVKVSGAAGRRQGRGRRGASTGPASTRGRSSGGSGRKATSAGRTSSTSGGATRTGRTRKAEAESVAPQEAQTARGGRGVRGARAPRSGPGPAGDAAAEPSRGSAAEPSRGSAGRARRTRRDGAS